MDLLEQLKLDLPAIEKDISQYAPGDGVLEYFKNLNEELLKEKRDLDNIKYCISAIYKWLKKESESQNTNEFSIFKDDLLNHQSKIEAYNFKLHNYSLPTKQYSIEKNNPIIFLSHKSDDKKYGDALEKLITGLGIKNDQLIYTSHPLHKIPLGQNIYDYLRSKITSNVYMIFLWSNKYLESPACMNEMGAAWVSKSDYTNLYTPDFKFGNPKYHECAVDIRKMGAVLKPDQNCRQSMIELRDTIVKMFNLTVDERTWTYLLDNFITEIGEAEKQGGEK